VDQRRFEIEKEERDQERSRRQLAQASSKKWASAMHLCCTSTLIYIYSICLSSTSK
jgi:hypothetical protein